MALKFLDPGMMAPVADFWASWHQDPIGTTYSGDTSGLADRADASPTFDTQHAVYTNPIVDNASQNSIGDNSNGLENPLHLEPTLTYAYTTGYTNTRSTSDALTVGVTQAFDYDFLGVGGGTTLSASGTFTWTDGTSEDKTRSVSEALGAPFDIPKGKVYEEKLIFTQETAAVPYTTAIIVDGNIGDIQFPNGFTYSPPVGEAFWLIELGTPPYGQPEPYKDVNWRDVHKVSDTEGTYLLHGSLTLEDAGTATVKIFDITHGGSQEVQAEYDAAVPVGVHRTMDDAGRVFHDTPFDDWVDGGAGDDRIRLRVGEEIAHAGAGDDEIRAYGVGRSFLDGEDGNDVIRLVSTAPGHTLHGGRGDDRIIADAPASMIYGGEGDDVFRLSEESAGGTVITDPEGRNRLRIDAEGPIGFERVGGSSNLYVLLDGGETYDRTRDVVWLGFFANPDNQVNGLRTAKVAELATTFRPGFLPDLTEPSTEQTIDTDAGRGAAGPPTLAFGLFD